MSAAHKLTFVERLPKRPYCSDYLPDGLRIRSLAQALQCRHIQHNPPAQVVSLVFDLDYPMSYFAWEDLIVPCPNWIAVNPENGHSHYGYILKAPVTRTLQARIKPLEWLAMIEGCLAIRLDADSSYSGLITKNPLHPDWDVYWFDHVEPYELDYLDQFCGDKEKKAYYQRLNSKEVSGLGRNVQIFDEARKWAYSAVRAYWSPDGFNNWQSGVEAHCRGLNGGFVSPLPDSEIRSISKSIAKWVWQRFTPNGFSSAQAKRGAKGGKVSKGGGRPSLSGKSRSELLPEVLRLKANGYSNRDIAQDLGIGSASVSRYLLASRK